MKLFAISGLGADKRAYGYLTLNHELIHVDWIKPQPNEPIINYSKRLIQEYGIDKETNFGIIGLSFGGLIATEIAKLTNPKFTILISSIENRSELRLVFKVLGKTKLLEIIPERLLDPPRPFARFMFGTDNKDILNSILDDTDYYFTKWAIRELINWKNQTKIPNLIKIGGTHDRLLPQKGDNTIFIEKGTHFMVADRADEVSQIINNQIKNYD